MYCSSGDSGGSRANGVNDASGDSANGILVEFSDVLDFVMKYNMSIEHRKYSEKCLGHSDQSLSFLWFCDPDSISAVQSCLARYQSKYIFHNTLFLVIMHFHCTHFQVAA